MQGLRISACLMGVLLVGACGDDGSNSTEASSAGSTGASAGTTSDGSTGATGAGTSSGATDSASGGSSGGVTSAGTGSTSGTGSTGMGQDTDGGPLSIRVITFNTGTTEGNYNGDGDDYGNDEAAISDQYYGDGLAWLEAMDSATNFLAEVQPDIIAFQEIFYSPDCVGIPPEAHDGFVCSTWTDGDPTVALEVLGPEYQLVCNLEKNDKCVAVRKAFGTFAGCDGDICMDFLDGVEIEGCGSGSRVGRGVIDLAGGGTLTVVHLHGTSGVLPEDQLCRVDQVDQIFDDFDGEPAANGTRNIILGDFNTDPDRMSIFDLSAQRWNDFVGNGEAFHFISPTSDDQVPSYTGLFNIDHIVSDVFDGDCHIPGASPGEDEVHPYGYFDHDPVVCDVVETL